MRRIRKFSNFHNFYQRLQEEEEEEEWIYLFYVKLNVKYRYPYLVVKYDF